MRHSKAALRLLLALVGGLALIAPVGAASSSYLTGFTDWRAADGGFSTWSTSGLAQAADGTLRLDPGSAIAGIDPYPPGGYNGHNFYNGGSFTVGEATGPVVPTGFAFTEAIASWNADTPAGTWIETQIRAQFGGRWSKWYNLGICNT